MKLTMHRGKCEAAVSGRRWERDTYGEVMWMPQEKKEGGMELAQCLKGG